jgi:hypothetical protein
MKTMELDKDTKDMLTDISTLFGVKTEIVKEVWEYTLFVWFLKMSENPDKMSTITVPYLGHVGVKFNSESLNNETGKIETKVDTFLSPSDAFKQMYGNIYNQAPSELAEYIQNHMIKTVIENQSQD